MTTIGIQFLAALRSNAEAWQAAEIDFATFTACLRGTWDAIRSAGPAVEAEVMQMLRDQLPTLMVSAGEKGSELSICRASRAICCAGAAADRPYDSDTPPARREPFRRR
jgi:hypothetical protein